MDVMDLNAHETVRGLSVNGGIRICNILKPNFLRAGTITSLSGDAIFDHHGA